MIVAGFSLGRNRARVGTRRPWLLAYEDGRAIGWVSVGSREDYARLVHSQVRPAIDDRPV